MRNAWQETAIGVAIAVAGTAIAATLGLVRDAGSATLVSLLMLLAFAAGLLAMRRATARYYRDVSAMTRASSDLPRRPQLVRLDADGIATEKPHPAGSASHSHWAWGDLTEAEESEGLLLFWIGHVHGFCVPIRAFPTPDEAREALAFARARIAAAR